MKSSYSSILSTELPLKPQKIELHDNKITLKPMDLERDIEISIILFKDYSLSNPIPSK